MKELVIVVDSADNEVGSEEKFAVHANGLLHRAFSLFVFNSQGNLLLQQRNRNKYHTPGLWSNTCCSHPRPGETLDAAVRRRLLEEMGFCCDVKEIFSFRYELPLENTMIEHEYNHVFIGFHDGDPLPDPAEVEAWRWLSLAEVRAEAARRPHLFTPWFTLILHDYGNLFDKALTAGKAGKRK